MNINTLEIDKLRIYGSAFWIAGAVLSFIVAVLVFDEDKNSLSK